MIVELSGVSIWSWGGRWAKNFCYHKTVFPLPARAERSVKVVTQDRLTYEYHKAIRMNRLQHSIPHIACLSKTILQSLVDVSSMLQHE